MVRHATFGSLWSSSRFRIASCPLPSTTNAGYAAVNNIRAISQRFGSVKSFRMYIKSSGQQSRIPRTTLSELQCSGVSLIDCPEIDGYSMGTGMMLGTSVARPISVCLPGVISGHDGSRRGQLRLVNTCVDLWRPGVGLCSVDLAPALLQSRSDRSGSCAFERPRPCIDVLPLGC